MKDTRRHFLRSVCATTLLPALGIPAWARLPSSGGDGRSPGASWPEHKLLKPDLANSLDARLLAKVPRNERSLAMHNWSATPSAEVVVSDASDDTPLVRLTSPMLNVGYLTRVRAANGSSTGGAGFLEEGSGANFWRMSLSPPQDWSSFNRIQFDLFVHDTGLPSYSFGMGFVDAAAPGAGPTDPLSFTFVHDLEIGRWNRIVWEFPETSRTQVDEFALFQPLRGPAGEVRYDLRALTLQTVEPEKTEGWEVAQDRIAFNHVGYPPSSSKLALASVSDATTFDLLDDATGKVVASFPVKSESSRIGHFKRLDFSSFEKPGRYRLRLGDTETRSFAIAENLWNDVVGKALNFFYADRCGHAAPGLHDACHADLQGEHEGDRKPLNGGWHDAGNGSQGSYRTAICTEGLLTMYEALVQNGGSPKLIARTVEEAAWGLDWLLKTRFGGGYRITDVGFNTYTDGRLGTYDDIVRPATFDTFENLLFVSVAASAARLLGQIDPARSAAALTAALDDYAATMRALPTAKPPRAERNSPAPFQQFAYGALAAIALYRATNRPEFLEDAVAFGDRLLACQHTDPLGKLQIAGYFYEDETRKSASHEVHTSFADAAPRALCALAATLPDHPRAAKWNSAAMLHARGFLAAGSEPTSPYRHLPNCVWEQEAFARYVDDAVNGLRHLPPNLGYRYVKPAEEPAMRASFHQEFEASLALTPTARLRTFPIPPDPIFHGATTIQLAQTNGLLAIARATGDAELQALAGRQLDWIFGLNPFSNCLMYGEGYDYPSQFQAIARNMVGSVPVGMDNRRDQPFWPTSNHFTFKEMWVVPAGHLLKVLAAVIAKPTLATRDRRAKG